MAEQQSRPGGRSQAAPDAFDGKTILRNADSWWRDGAERGVTWLAEAGFSFTVDDLIDLGVPEPDLPCRWGALIASAARTGRVELVGYTQGRRGGLVRVWRGVRNGGAG